MWLYFRFRLSYRDVEELMLIRGVCDLRGEPPVVPEVWAGFANELRQRRLRPGDKWHLDGGAPRTHSRKAGVWSCKGEEGGRLGAGVQA